MKKTIDMHVHVGLLGDKWPKWGRFSSWYRQQLVYKTFLLFARLEEDKVCDTLLHETTIEAINTSGLDHVVCLALDPVFDNSGNRREDASHVWVANEYVTKLRKEIGSKVLFGASVHPYDPDFESRIKKCVDDGAVLIKWLPSAQQINLADTRVLNALNILAKVKNGNPLPLLLHVGPEYAIPSSDPKTASFDYLSWTGFEGFINMFRGKNKFYKPEVDKIRENILRALDNGATIIFAHCGLPYFTSGVLADIFEHSDFDVVKYYLEQSDKGRYRGNCYADVSAFCTPFRKGYFRDISALPSARILYGSDFPTPAFRLFVDLKQAMDDLKAIMKGHLERIIVPDENMLSFNYNELLQAFPGHPMFTNFGQLL